jgi:hypothetical protein
MLLGGEERPAVLLLNMLLLNQLIFGLRELPLISSQLFFEYVNLRCCIGYFGFDGESPVDVKLYFHFVELRLWGDLLLRLLP